MTFISRILGFLRDMVAAQVFGASGGYDAFIIAFKIPNFMRRLVAEGAFSQAFVPVLAQVKTSHPKQVKGFINHMASRLLVGVGILTLLGILGAKGLIALFAPGFIGDPTRFEVAVSLLQITFGYIFFISLTALASGIQNTYGRFALAAFTPVILNLSMIIATVWVAPLFLVPIKALAWGVLIGGVLQLAWQIPALRSLKLLPTWSWGKKDEGVARVWKLMIPAIFAAAVLQINLMVNAIFASFLPVGSISWLYYADRLLEFPLGVFGVALSSVILPHLSEHHAKKNQVAFSAAVNWAMRWVVLIGVPASLGLWCLSEEILCALFHYGAFSMTDVMMTAGALNAFSLGIISFIGTKVLVSAYYARMDTKLPVKVAVVTLLLNMVGNFLLMKPFGHIGLAISSTLAAWVNLVWLLASLQYKQVATFHKGWPLFLVRVLLAGVFMGWALTTLSPDLSRWVSMGCGFRLMSIVSLVALGALFYLMGLWITGVRIKDLGAHEVKEQP